VGETRQVEVEGKELRLTNLDKVLYPEAGFTKADVLDYYRRVAPVLLPHLADRPLTLKRYPNGVNSQFFYEKQCPRHRPEWVRTATVQGICYCLVADLPTLMWTSNLADLELHTPMITATDPTRSTMVVFDLDPGPPAGIEECCQVALVLKGLFDQLGLQSFAKTSGSKGMQLYVPVNGDGVDADLAKGFARAVAETLEQGMPDLVVSRMTKAIRGGKVLVDWSQNDDHKTTVCVYSLRAKDRPTVSTPVTWEEVAGDPAKLSFEAHEVVERVERVGDLFAPVVTLRQELPVGTTA
jgi:bifunctional non-homologous end joining protein LigD